MTASYATTGLPAFFSLALRPLPTAPLEIALQRLANSIVMRHPGLLDRLGSEGARRFGIEPLDLPFAIVIEVVEATVHLSVVRRLDTGKVDARVTGSLLSLIDLVDGRHDGDALFFSRDISVEGDIEAVLALRNAIDDAELDLLREAAQLAGPLSVIAEQIARATVRALAHVAALPAVLSERTRQ
jgi:predicted lipid carrier protein YhbT